MRLLWVELRDFRNHEETRLDVPEGLVVAVGANGEGKTNLLEGMYYLFALSSPRVSATMPLVRAGAESAYARGEVQAGDARILIEVEIPTNAASRLQVNRSPLRRKRELRRQVRAVFFGPEDLDIVRGEPSHRRRFLDEAVLALWPLRDAELRAYERALRQRNRLLKEWEGPGAPGELDAWDAELVQSGSAVLRARAAAIERVAPLADEEFRRLSGYGLVCRYQPAVWGEPLEEAFASRLAERRADELIRRTSLVGPHRDDLELAVRDLGARSFASHGEAWGAALCLRLALGSAVTEEIRDTPVLLLDDPFSALDPARQRGVAEGLSGRGQVVISVADEAAVPREADAIWDVSAGSVSERKAG
ncbi:MAG: DNA replication/repair protein RecF [Actinomycetota bacterium]|nr:DNA replication/repair protein RecF [Actinomycetota bacterium]